MNWRREQTGWTFSRQGVAWHRMPAPAGWWRWFHQCTAHTTSVHGREVTQRCTCGAARFGELHPLVTPWAPSIGIRGADVAGLKVKMTNWTDRNSRRRGTALVYRPYVHALEES
jgi:hypothetical protein